MRAFVYAICLAVLQTTTAESSAIFPALRKRLEKQKLAAAQVKEDVVPVDDKDVGPVAPATVPSPVDAGSDGFPQLPAVSTMLSDASVSLKAVSSQASSLEARVVQAQMQSESKMAKQKAAFDEKLKQQEQGNRQVIQANDKIAAEIKDLKNGNAALKKRARVVGDSNKAMRTEIRTLQGRLGVAQAFTAKSLTTTDDSKSSLLQVLHKSPQETSSKSHSKHDDDDDDEEGSDDDQDEDDNDNEATSFLALSSKAHHEEDGAASFEAAMSDLDAAVPTVSTLGVDTSVASPSSPGDLLAVLSKDVAHLAQQERESDKKLKQLFIRDFRAGAKRHVALIAKQKGLSATRSSLLQVQAKLKSAVEHLESTNKQIEGRLHGLGQYLQKLAHFAMAPQKEVAHLVEVLPKTVTIKAEKEPAV